MQIIIIKTGGVCIYYKDSLPVRIKLFPYPKETLFLEMIHNNKKVIVFVIYRSPSQNNSKLDSLLTKVNQLLRKINKCKPFLAVITMGFNERSPAWWTKDVHTTERSKLFLLTFWNGFSQLISELTHIKVNISSCIDSILTDQSDLSLNSGVHSPLHQNCHHHIVSFPPTTISKISMGL